jgi:hypothetical protein
MTPDGVSGPRPPDTEGDVPPLPDAQRALAALIRAPSEPDDAQARAVLRPLAGRAPRLAIYREAYRGRLIDALRSNYPVLHRVLGDEAFAVLAIDYLASYPSQERSIRWFGHRLAAWLDERLRSDPQALPHPALPDLARMEWAIGLSFDAADDAPLSREALAARAPGDWPGLRFKGHPSAAVVSLAWDVEPLWRSLTDDPDAGTEPPASHAHRLLVWRQGLDSRWRSLPADEADALEACLCGCPFGAVCEQVAGAGPADAPASEPAQRVAGWLLQWVAAGLLRLDTELSPG